MGYVRSRESFLALACLPMYGSGRSRTSNCFAFAVWPTTVVNTECGASSFANPALIVSDPLSNTKAVLWEDILQQNCGAILASA